MIRSSNESDSVCLLEDENITTLQTAYREDFIQQLIKVSTNQAAVISRQSSILNHIKYLENTMKRLNYKIDKHITLHERLNNIDYSKLVIFCENHQSNNSISWLPDNVESNIYLTFFF